MASTLRRIGPRRPTDARPGLSRADELGTDVLSAAGRFAEWLAVAGEVAEPAALSE
jgi:hypothetical protein